jgi:serine/threonine-protein kinase HipA
MTSKGQGRVSAVYVWTQIQGEPVLAGRFERVDGVGVFYYAKSYIARQDAYPLDPVNLPLVGEREFHTRANDGHFGVLLDSGPDSWGERVLGQLSQSRPRNKLEFMIAGNGEGVGSLLFSLSRSAVKMPDFHARTTVELSVIEQAARDVQSNKSMDEEQLPAQVRQALVDSSWLGGARPKASIWVDGKAYMAKFSLSSDVYDQVKAEHASLMLARDAGFEVPNSQLVDLSTGRQALLIERFDPGLVRRKPGLFRAGIGGCMARNLWSALWKDAEADFTARWR